jgi:hypothetical protein
VGGISRHATSDAEWRALRRHVAPAGEGARDADGGRRTTGAAGPGRRGTEARHRRPGSGATGRSSRGGPSSRTPPSPRGRQRSRIAPWRKPHKNRETPPRKHTRGAQVGASARRHMGYPTPTPVRRRTLRGVARPAQHGAVADVERRTARGERDDVIDGQVAGSVGGTLVSRAPVAVLTTPGAQHAGAETLPGPRAVEGVVPAAVGLAGVFSTAATSEAGDDTADRAQLHGSRRASPVSDLTVVTLECTPVDIVMSVIGGACEVYPPRVLGLRARETEEMTRGLSPSLVHPEN